MINGERGMDRRRWLGWGGLAAAVVAAGGTLLASARPGKADPAIQPDTRPGGAYDRFVADLAAQDKLSGVVLLARHGRIVLARSYGMADKEKGIANHVGTAVNLSSAIQ